MPPQAADRQSPHVVADQSAVAAFLSRPESFGPEVTRVERFDTHGAMVFLAGERAYKIKRAVRYPYMDFSTLARRREVCEREIDLNRRTAPDLYLGTAPIIEGPHGRLSFVGPGEPVEWMVVMQRFDQRDLFDSLAESGRLTAQVMIELAEEIAAFHTAAEILARVSGAAAAARVIEENAAEFPEHPDLFSKTDREDLTAAARALQQQLVPLLDQRAAEGFIRRCHGDLHLRNICLFRGRPTLFDAIEFNDDFSAIDVLYDFAFLLMDLEHRGLRPLANLVFNRYLQRTGDIAGLAALPLFLSIRAAVRAKVAASSADSQPDAAACAAQRAAAAQYFQSARHYLAPQAPRLWAVGGLSGSGKTSLAARLAPDLGRAPGGLHLRSDVIRKELCGVPELTSLPPSAYGPESHARVYEVLIARAKTGLAAGQSVIVDAVFADPAERAALEGLADAQSLPFTGLWLEAREDLLRERVTARRQDASDATAAVVEQQLGYNVGPLTWHRIDAAGSELETLEQALKHLG